MARDREVPLVDERTVLEVGDEDGRGLLRQAAEGVNLSNAGQSVDLLRGAVRTAGEAPITTGPVTAIEVSGGIDLGGQVTVCLTQPEVISALAVPLPVPNGLHVIAVIRWGQGGHFETVEVDAIRGVQISVPTAALRVSLDARTVPNTQPFAVRAGAFVGYYTRPSSRVPPSRTFYGTAGPVQAVSVAVPVYATSVTVSRIVVAQPFTVEFLDGGAVPAILATFAVPGGAQLEGFPLPGAARVVRVLNPGPLADTYNILFGLSL